ncbi:hypothetical protein [Hydrogenimonas sp.]
MKKLWPLLLLVVALLAQERTLSPIPLPHTVIVDLDPTRYDEAMLQDALERGYVFTFLAKSRGVEAPDLLVARRAYLEALHLGVPSPSSSYRVAFLLSPKKIGKYAASTTTAALTYLVQRGKPFEMRVVTLADENASRVAEALASLEGYDLVVAPMTQEGAEALCHAATTTPIFVPTLHVGRLACANPSVTFGGIDYERQIEILARLVDANATTYVVQDHSPLAQTLTRAVEAQIPVKETITLGRNGYYKPLIERYDDLNQSTLFLNVPVVKSSLFLSQMTLADYKPTLLLSTQLNYSPLLLTLTQYHDRENLVVASSIGDADPYLTEYESLMGENIRFNWVDYATVVGLDGDYAHRMGESRLTTEGVVNGSVAYEVRLYEAGLYRFIPKEVPPAPEEREPVLYDESPDSAETPDSEPSVYDAPFSQEESSD